MDTPLFKNVINSLEKIRSDIPNVLTNPRHLANILNNPLFLISFMITVLIWISLVSYNYYQFGIKDIGDTESYRCPDYWTANNDNKTNYTCTAPKGLGLPKDCSNGGMIKVRNLDNEIYIEGVKAEYSRKEPWKKHCGPWGHVKSNIE